MIGKKSRQDVLEFLDYLGQKGLMSKSSVAARKAAVSKILGILDKDEASDVTTIDFDEVVNRFGHLQGKGYTPQSLSTYRSRAKSALDDFASYLENPLAFKPSVQSRERKSLSSKHLPKSTEDLIAEPSKQPVSTVAGPMSSSILPIPIRADLTVYVQGLPFDLTVTEAKKIAGVIQAMAAINDNVHDTQF